MIPHTNQTIALRHTKQINENSVLSLVSLSFEYFVVFILLVSVFYSNIKIIDCFYDGSLVLGVMY